ncbi:hypothetical protein [Mucilaginibacter arboris]|uniref:Uncharacterized protein n=1 Tax=Mucilaginibacter arboris TaxID=2682090 RepID=A0A7K1T1J9_9SPHI|nr:hypothetical protein [Mucilaginibacter arboris]MVN23462.1 hypothetical protein [Mucilaginibacter arboris]
MTKKPNTKEKGTKKGSIVPGFVPKETGDLFINQDSQEISKGTELQETKSKTKDILNKEIPLEITNEQGSDYSNEIKEELLTPQSNISSFAYTKTNQYYSQRKYDEQTKKEGKISYDQQNVKQSQIAFFEVNIGNVLQYFSAGIVYPSKYSVQNAFSDVQSINNEFLALSTGLSSNFNGESVLIKIDTTNINAKDIQDFEGYKLVKSALPISRIIKVFVTSDAAKQQLLEESQLRDGGIIPNDLISVGIPNDLPSITVNRSTITGNDLSFSLSRFDKILGLVAGIKNYNILTLGKTDIYKTLSDHFFYAIQAIDPAFGKNIVSSTQHSEFYKWLIAKEAPTDRLLLSWIINRIYLDSNFTDKDTKAFKQLCLSSKGFNNEENQLDQIFINLQKTLERKSVFKNILELESSQKFPLFLFSYLRIYGTKTNPELPRLDLSKSPPVKYGEYSFAILNMFFGYKLLRNTEDRLNNIPEEYFKLNSRINKPAIKFELSTRFDYLVIDKVFNYVFSENIGELNLAQIDHLKEERNEVVKFDDNFSYVNNIIYGKAYHQLSKLNPLDALIPLLMRLPTNIPLFSEIGYCCYRLRLKTSPSHFSEILNNETPFIDSIKYPRSLFIEAIKEGKMELEEIKFRLNMAVKYKELI